jgi:hypothetical protein
LSKGLWPQFKEPTLADDLLSGAKTAAWEYGGYTLGKAVGLGEGVYDITSDAVIKGAKGQAWVFIDRVRALPGYYDAGVAFLDAATTDPAGTGLSIVCGGDCSGYNFGRARGRTAATVLVPGGMATMAPKLVQLAKVWRATQLARRDGLARLLAVSTQGVGLPGSRQGIKNRSTPTEYYVEDAADPQLWAAGEVRNGVLEVSMQTRYIARDGSVVRGALRGKEEFDAIVSHFEGQFTAIRGRWIDGDNLAHLRLTNNPNTTWTGQQAERHGYGNATMVDHAWLPGTDDGVWGGVFDFAEFLFTK